MTLANIRTLVSLLALGTAILVADVRPVSARTLDEAMKGLAGSVESYLKARNESGIVVGQFTGPDGTSSGTSMKNRLIDELRALKVEMQKVGLRVDGEFSREIVDNRTVVEISVTMKDRNNNAVQQFNALAVQEKVDNPEDVAVLTGANVARPAAGSVAKALAEAIRKPGFEAIGPVASIVAPSKGVPYRMELLARPAGQGDFAPRPAIDQQGLPFCEIAKAEEYVVKLYNDSDYDCAVQLTIDGLNSFEFSSVPQFKQLGMWIIPRKSTLIVPGWHISNTEAKTFLVVDLPGAAAAKLGRDPGKIGTVTACFFAAWSDGEVQPPIEATRFRGAGTTLGPSTATNFQTVLRYIGQTMQAAVSIRYSR